MLAAVSTTTRHGSNIIVDPITDEGRLESGSGKLKVFLTQYSSLSGLKVSTGKLLDALIMKFTAQNGYRQSPDKMNTSVTLPLKEYLHSYPSHLARRGLAPPTGDGQHKKSLSTPSKGFQRDVFPLAGSGAAPRRGPGAEPLASPPFLF